ncbi:MAG: hypothetical protein QXZ44_05165 [Ferroplasma sp.]
MALNIITDMENSFMKILRCPSCHESEFEIALFSENTLYMRTGIEANYDIIEQEIKKHGNGIIFCMSCKNWFPITEGLPVMLANKLRNEDECSAFIEKYRSNIPENLRNAYLFKYK